MKLFTAATFLAAAVGQVIAQGVVTLNTPAGVTQCLSSVLTWTGGTPPYILTVNPGGQPAAAPLRNLGSVSGNSLSWKCDIAAGQSIFFRIRDSAGQLGETASVTVLPGTDGVCLTAIQTTPASTAGTTAPGTSAPPPPPVTSNPPAGTTGGGPGTTAPAGTTAAGGTTTPKPTTTPGSSATGLMANLDIVVAGAFAMGAALLA